MQNTDERHLDGNADGEPGGKEAGTSDGWLTRQKCRFSGAFKVFGVGLLRSFSLPALPALWGGLLSRIYAKIKEAIRKRVGIIPGRNKFGAVRDGSLRKLLIKAARVVVLNTWALFIGTLFLRVLNRLHVRGRENIPRDGAFLILANHISALDPFIIGYGIWPRRFDLAIMAKAELFEIPVVRSIIKAMGAYPVRRGQRDTNAIEATLQRLSEGMPLLLFPEGTRTRDGCMGRGKIGVGRIVHLAKVPVVPAVINGSHRLIPVGSVIPRLFTKIEVVYGEPLRFDKYDHVENTPEISRAITDEVMLRIKNLAEENLSPSETPYAWREGRILWREEKREEEKREDKKEIKPPESPQDSTALLQSAAHEPSPVPPPVSSTEQPKAHPTEPPKTHPTEPSQEHSTAPSPNVHPERTPEEIQKPSEETPVHPSHHHKTHTHKTHTPEHTTEEAEAGEPPVEPHVKTPHTRGHRTGEEDLKENADRMPQVLPAVPPQVQHESTLQESITEALPPSPPPKEKEHGEVEQGEVKKVHEKEGKTEEALQGEELKSEEMKLFLSVEYEIMNASQRGIPIDGIKEEFKAAKEMFEKGEHKRSSEMLEKIRMDVWKLVRAANTLENLKMKAAGIDTRHENYSKIRYHLRMAGSYLTRAAPERVLYHCEEIEKLLPCGSP